MPEKAYAEQWQLEPLEMEVARVFNLDLPITEWGKEEGIADEEIRERITAAVDRHMAERAANTGPEIWRMVEKSLMLQILDQHWKEHLLALDHLRQGIGLRAYGQRDPLNEYKREAFDMFGALLGRLREAVATVLSHIELKIEGEGDPGPELRRPEVEMHASHIDFFNGEDEARRARRRARRQARRRRARPRDPRAGAGCRATPRARATRAASTSTATARSPEGGG